MIFVFYAILVLIAIAVLSALGVGVSERVRLAKLQDEVQRARLLRRQVNEHIMAKTCYLRVGAHWQDGQQLKIEHCFVQPHLHHLLQPGARRTEEVGSRHTVRQILKEAIDARRRSVVIEGLIGSGKTTLAQWLAYRLAQVQQDRHSRRPWAFLVPREEESPDDLFARLGARMPAEEERFPYPILIELDQQPPVPDDPQAGSQYILGLVCWALKAEEEKEKKRDTGESAEEEEGKRRGCAPSFRRPKPAVAPVVTVQHVSSWARAGQLLLILDGLDELAPTERQLLLDALGRFLDSYPQYCPAILTTSSARGLADDCWRIAPFDERQIRAFIRKRYRERDDRRATERANRLWKGLCEAAKMSPRLWEIAIEPLLLSILVSLANVDDPEMQFSTDRSQYYELYIQRLLGARREIPAAERPVEDPLDARLRATAELCSQVDPGTPEYAELLALQNRLDENIGLARVYGDTETRRAERAQIIAQLDQISRQVQGRPFRDLVARTVRAPDLELKNLVSRVARMAYEAALRGTPVVDTSSFSSEDHRQFLRLLVEARDGHRFAHRILQCYLASRELLRQSREAGAASLRETGLWMQMVGRGIQPQARPGYADWSPWWREILAFGVSWLSVAEAKEVIAALWKPLWSSPTGRALLLRLMTAAGMRLTQRPWREEVEKGTVFLEWLNAVATKTEQRGGLREADAEPGLDTADGAGEGSWQRDVWEAGYALGAYWRDIEREAWEWPDRVQAAHLLAGIRHPEAITILARLALHPPIDPLVLKPLQEVVEQLGLLAVPALLKVKVYCPGGDTASLEHWIDLLGRAGYTYRSRKVLQGFVARWQQQHWADSDTRECVAAASFRALGRWDSGGADLLFFYLRNISLLTGQEGPGERPWRKWLRFHPDAYLGQIPPWTAGLQRKLTQGLSSLSFDDLVDYGIDAASQVAEDLRSVRGSAHTSVLLQIVQTKFQAGGMDCAILNDCLYDYYREYQAYSLLPWILNRLQYLEARINTRGLRIELASFFLERIERRRSRSPDYILLSEMLEVARRSDTAVGWQWLLRAMHEPYLSLQRRARQILQEDLPAAALTRMLQTTPWGWNVEEGQLPPHIALQIAPESRPTKRTT